MDPFRIPFSFSCGNLTGNSKNKILPIHGGLRFVSVSETTAQLNVATAFGILALVYQQSSHDSSLLFGHMNAFTPHHPVVAIDHAGMLCMDET